MIALYEQRSFIRKRDGDNQFQRCAFSTARGGLPPSQAPGDDKGIDI